MPDLSFDKMNVLIQQGAPVITASSSQHVTPRTIFYFYIFLNGLVQERRNSIANALGHRFDIRIQVITHTCPNFNGSFGMDPPQQTSLAPCWPNEDPVGSTLGQCGRNVPCYLGWEITFCSLYGCNNLCLHVSPRVLCNIGYLSETPLELNLAKPHSSITLVSIVQSFCNFAHSMAVIISCSVQHFKMIGLFKWMLWIGVKRYSIATIRYISR